MLKYDLHNYTYHNELNISKKYYYKFKVLSELYVEKVQETAIISDT